MNAEELHRAQLDAVGAVAEEEGRSATLIDLDERAVEEARTTTAQTGLFAGGAA